MTAERCSGMWVTPYCTASAMTRKPPSPSTTAHPTTTPATSGVPIRMTAIQAAEERRRRQREEQLRTQHADVAAASAAPDRPQTVRRDGRKVGRNEPCPCGSGKKYKHCHGKLS